MKIDPRIQGYGGKLFYGGISRRRKLNAEQVRKLREHGANIKKLAKEFGITSATAYRVKRKETYREIV